ncbi:MAG: hypothetical protein GY861_10065 [bacterium]|nr:hypothetical protein [bacterium]
MPPAVNKASVKEEEQFYIGLTDPNTVRRSLLESSKSIVQSLQRYEKVRDIRKQKESEIENFKAIVKDLMKTIAELKADMPPIDLTKIPREDDAHIDEDEKKLMAEKKAAKAKPKPVKKAPVKKAPVKKAAPPPPPVKKEVPVMEKLEDQLNDIESRLKKL